MPGRTEMSWTGGGTNGCNDERINERVDVWIARRIEG